MRPHRRAHDFRIIEIDRLRGRVEGGRARAEGCTQHRSHIAGIAHAIGDDDQRCACPRRGFARGMARSPRSPVAPPSRLIDIITSASLPARAYFAPALRASRSVRRGGDPALRPCRAVRGDKERARDGARSTASLSARTPSITKARSRCRSRRLLSARASFTVGLSRLFTVVTMGTSGVVRGQKSEIRRHPEPSSGKGTLRLRESHCIWPRSLIKSNATKRRANRSRPCDRSALCS